MAEGGDIPRPQTRGAGGKRKAVSKSASVEDDEDLAQSPEKKQKVENPVLKKGEDDIKDTKEGDNIKDTKEGDDIKDMKEGREVCED